MLWIIRWKLKKVGDQNLWIGILPMEVFIVQNEHEYLSGQKNFYQNNF